MKREKLRIHPLSQDRWSDLVDLFGPERGANSGCWCMWPFLRGKDWNAMTREQRRDAFNARVSNGPAPGLLAYSETVPIGWVAVGPREGYVRFQLSKTGKPLAGDEAGLIRATYAVTCFFVRKGYRKSGVMAELLAAAEEFARARGAMYLDACPIDPDKPLQWGEGFVGIASLFTRNGFEEIARRSPRRPLMRKTL